MAESLQPCHGFRDKQWALHTPNWHRGDPEVRQNPRGYYNGAGMKQGSKDNQGDLHLSQCVWLDDIENPTQAP